MLARTMSAAAFSASPGSLPVQEAISLYAALETIFDVTAGLRCQPRFARDDAEAGKAQAGDELDEMTNAIADRMGALVDEMLFRFAMSASLPEKAGMFGHDESDTRGNGHATQDFLENERGRDIVRVDRCRADQRPGPRKRPARRGGVQFFKVHVRPPSAQRWNARGD